VKLVECVPNFSEGRDKSVVDAIKSAIASVEGVAVLDVRKLDEELMALSRVHGGKRAVQNGCVALVAVVFVPAVVCDRLF